MAIRRILVITIFYPSPATPTKFVFVQNIVESMARQGCHCLVVQPISLFHARNRSGFPFHETKEIENGGRVEVFRPSYWPMPILPWGAALGLLNPNWLKFRCFSQAVLRVIRETRFSPDVVYGHFLYFAGGCAIDVAQALNVSSFIGVGEGEFWSIQPMGSARAKRHLRGATGFIPNATHLLRKLAVELDIPKQRMVALPNGVDMSVFKPHDRQMSRRAMGVPSDAFVVGAVGGFLHKKGLVRVGQAIDELQGVCGIFAGSGAIPPVGKNVLWAKSVAHDQLPLMLSACDVFVLPTLIEGCCNAIIEAMACGLPIISSNTEYTEDLLTDDCAIRIDPMDVHAIREAIITLRDQPALRRRLAAAALDRAQKFDNNKRARRLLAFMGENRINCS